VSDAPETVMRGLFEPDGATWTARALCVIRVGFFLAAWAAWLAIAAVCVAVAVPWAAPWVALRTLARPARHARPRRLHGGR
jgi:hypothetical protein